MWLLTVLNGQISVECLRTLCSRPLLLIEQLLLSVNFIHLLSYQSEHFRWGSGHRLQLFSAIYVLRISTPSVIHSTQTITTFISYRFPESYIIASFCGIWLLSQLAVLKLQSGFNILCLWAFLSFLSRKSVWLVLNSFCFVGVDRYLDRWWRFILIDLVVLGNTFFAICEDKIQSKASLILLLS